MAEFFIEQAVYHLSKTSNPALEAHSPGFLQEWNQPILHILQAFDPSTDWQSSSIIFAYPMAKRHVLVVRVGCLQETESGPIWGYHVLVISRKAYERFLGDPFAVAEKFQPDWRAKEGLPTLTWPEQPMELRTVAQVQEVLQRVKYAALKEDVPGEEQIEDMDPAERSEGPALLGGVQILVDGGRLVFERPAPDLSLLRAIWTLLPQTTRAKLWPTTFAFNNNLKFDILVVEKYSAEIYPGYTTEDQAADYPEGRYELALQIAAESGDQQGLDDLYHRRSIGETLRLVWILLISMVLIVFLSNLFRPPSPTPAVRARQSQIVSGIVGMNNPLNSITYWNVSREELNRLKKQIEQVEQ